MEFGEIFSNSLKYPLSNPQVLIILGVICLVGGLSSVFTQFGVRNTALSLILSIVSLLVSFFLFGYALTIIKYGIERNDELPAFDWVKNFVDGIKVFVVSFVYMIVPTLVVSILGVVSLGPALSRIFTKANVNQIATATNSTVAVKTVFSSVPPEVWSALFTGFSIVSIVAIILFLIFGIFSDIALCRLAKFEEFGQAFNFGEIFNDIRQIGILKILAFLIIAYIIVAVIALISGLLVFIPFIGIIISLLICPSFSLLFYNRALGLLYSDI